MFGYVRPMLHELPKAEQERFRACYCGLCHTLGRHYGFAARFLLNYDFTFLAILLSLDDDMPCKQCRCAAHFFRRCSVAGENAGLAYAADHSVILSWWQLRDHIQDSGPLRALPYRIAALLLRKAYRRAQEKLSDFDLIVQNSMRELAALEDGCCDSIDAAAEPFARLMASLADTVEDLRTRRIFSHLFYHLGRWIYLTDAADDYEKDMRSGNYNPLRYRYQLSEQTLPEWVRDAVGLTLDSSIREMAGAYALLAPGKWTAVLDSIFYKSLYGIGRAVLEGVYHRPARFWRRYARDGK